MTDVGLTITQQREIISRAKARIIEELGATEHIAHVFIRELSMQSGQKMFVIAQTILELDTLT
jgi:AmiR/NasT family two-component response regulator